MASSAILIANASYTHQSDLECCREDLAAMKALVEATGRYTTIRTVSDKSADGMRDALREAILPDGRYQEILFYFSGHGAQIGSEFYFCGTDFDAERPNQTGLSNSELHDICRAAKPELLVKVVDACASGTLLIKSDREAVPFKKDGLKSVIQFSSSLQEQNSFGGDPLSEFTRAFCDASIRKTEGPVYYSDVINILRDEFIENDEQTPFFVAQGTGRELLVDDAEKLQPFREEYQARWSATSGGQDGEAQEDGAGSRELVSSEPPSTMELLMAAEEKMGSPDVAKAMIDRLFDGVLNRFKLGELADIFELETAEHADFREPTARDLIIKVLARESRPDNFVRAEIKRVKRKPSPFDRLTTSLATSMMMLDPEWTEQYDLELNCRLERAQLVLTLTPKFRTLRRLVLVLSCAPSLERCYIFEVLTQHARTDWDGFDYEGSEIVRRWYKVSWDESVDGIIEKVAAALEQTVRTHVNSAAARLSDE